MGLQRVRHNRATNTLMGFSGGSVGKNSPAMQETQEVQIQSLGQENPLEEGMATHSSIPAWRIPLRNLKPTVQEVAKCWT